MKRPLIIERPDLQDWQQKAVFGALTAVFWVIWVFLWMPLITLIGWFFFGYQFHLEMVELNGYARFLNVLVVYAIVIGSMGGGLMLWALYNDIRFRGIDRRKTISAPSTDEMGDWAKHPASLLAQWQNCAVVTVHHNPDGSIESVVPALNARNISAVANQAQQRPVLVPVPANAAKG
ncbi:MAG: poly-beta,6-N-acetyl-D-glucosamine biosynthesis protein PgaD [Rhodoferax sp.]|nr:poly-beta,6-N-acetyl-D-glucosamine biosynthesis protein PgaD [Rhodoferax sp.]